jgi:hypothetical protein
MTEHGRQEVATKLEEAADVVRVLPSRQRVEAIIEQAGNGRVWRPVLGVAAEGAAVPTRPATQSRKEKRGAGEWKEAKGFRIYLVGQERIAQSLSWQQIATEEEVGEALRFAATLVPVERVRSALLGDGAKWLWPQLQAACPTKSSWTILTARSAFTKWRSCNTRHRTSKWGGLRRRGHG